MAKLTVTTTSTTMCLSIAERKYTVGGGLSEFGVQSFMRIRFVRSKDGCEEGEERKEREVLGIGRTRM